MPPTPLRPGQRPRRTFTPALPKPDACAGCILEKRGQGFVQADGPTTAPILLVGEAAGYDEIAAGRPFVGAAGSMLTKILRMNGYQREDYRIDNVIRCFPGDTLVEARGIRHGFRRWYIGEVVTAVTGEGQLTGTPNHPVLTGRGWVPLGQLTVGDHLIRGGFGHGSGRCDPDVERVPAAFRELYDALSHAGVRHGVVGRDVDFHGDGRETEVEVVSPHGLLRERRQAPSAQELFQHPLKTPHAGQRVLIDLRAGFRAALAFLGGIASTACGLVRGSRLGTLLFGGQATPMQAGRVAAATQGHASVSEGVMEAALADAEAVRDTLDALPLPIGSERIVEIKRTRFSGHVYNLSTTSVQYIANGYIVHNCAPPELALEGTGYAASAIAHCRYRDQTLAEGHRVVVPLGSVALRTILGLDKVKGVRVQDFHGTVSRDPSDRFWVVPTFHPSHLQRGATNLLGTVSFDLQRAHEVAREGRAPDPATVVCDPPLDWFRVWCAGFLAALAQDPEGVWLSVDIETPDKGADEGELQATGGDASYRILRVNLACHPDEGITVPFEGEYISELAALFAEVARLGGIILMWFRGFDLPRLLAAGMKLTPSKVWDLMWMAKVLQSDLPMGLGFWAPFYSSFGPWKHLATTHPSRYAAIDGFQTLRVGYGIVGDLVDAGQWGVFERHLHDFHTYVLQPASDIGVPINRPRLEAFGQKLDAAATRLLEQIQACVPESLRPLTPKEGLTRAPAPGEVHTKGRATKKDGTAKKEAPDPIKAAFYAQAPVVQKLVVREVQTCSHCRAIEVAKTHRCADGTPKEARMIVPEPATVTRWFWQEPFNADSPKQLLEYVKLRGHEPGRNKKSGGDSVDRETLERLARTKDPLYQYLLDYRAVAKVRGTYVLGTEKRLDADDRLHPTFTFKPSTMRLSCVAPNIQNVVSDRGGSESLAAGFRKCVTGREGEPGWLTPEARVAWEAKWAV